ncbi:86_t:CDS:2 [Ambispora gerdemannii]|uniref:86_t:CDS:1 n=1 Tax=Ambispora gerdemannii TaxID=144530 RepID=A0A9N8VQJ6_9GLOM|nr:86_t:CDS:2 [Ambispora gerdemannii]
MDLEAPKLEELSQKDTNITQRAHITAQLEKVIRKVKVNATKDNPLNINTRTVHFRWPQNEETYASETKQERIGQQQDQQDEEQQDEYQQGAKKRKRTNSASKRKNKEKEDQDKEGDQDEGRLEESGQYEAMDTLNIFGNDNFSEGSSKYWVASETLEKRIEEDIFIVITTPNIPH